MIASSIIISDISSWLKEDIPYWDVSSRNLPKNYEVTAKLISKQAGMISGVPVALEVFKQCNIEASFHLPDGSEVFAGDLVIQLKGALIDILYAERVALNILSHMSGITTIVQRLRKAVAKINPKLIIAATRKTLPGLRVYEKWAVTVAGGDTHRMDLSSMILLKENHLQGFASISECLHAVSKGRSFSQKIEIEVKSQNEAIEATKTGIPDIIMLDNFDVAMIPQILSKLKRIQPDMLIEASGNISEKNIARYAKSGVNIISLGCITHSVESFDFSLVVDREVAI